MIGSLHQTIERWQNLKGQELPIATKCFVTFTFGPPNISIKTEFRPWSNFEYPPVRILKFTLEKEKQRQKQKQKTKQM